MLVKVTAAGTIDRAAAGDGNLAGSLNGVFYTDPSTQKPTWAKSLCWQHCCC